MTRLDETVDRVVGVDVGAVPDSALGRQILLIDRQLRRLEAARAARIREFERRYAAVADGAASAVSWLRARTNSAAGDLRAARTLGRSCDRLPVMAAALAAGDISVAHVQILAAATRDLDRERVAADEKELTDLAREFDPRMFRVCVQHWVTVAFPDRHEKDSEKKYDSRWLRLSETISGMVSVAGMLDPETARPVLLALESLARKAGTSDERTQAQRTADALGDLARTAINTDQLRVTGGGRPTVNVTVIEETLRGSGDGAPATYDDGAPLIAAQVGRTVCDARFARLVVNAVGEMLDLGRITRDISPALRKYLHLRGGGCRVAGCDKPAHAPDAHHIVW